MWRHFRLRVVGVVVATFACGMPVLLLLGIPPTDPRTSLRGPQAWDMMAAPSGAPGKLPPTAPVASVSGQAASRAWPLGPAPGGVRVSSQATGTSPAPAGLPPSPLVPAPSPGPRRFTGAGLPGVAAPGPAPLGQPAPQGTLVAGGSPRVSGFGWRRGQGAVGGRGSGPDSLLHRDRDAAASTPSRAPGSRGGAVGRTDHQRLVDDGIVSTGTAHPPTNSTEAARTRAVRDALPLPVVLRTGADCLPNRSAFAYSGP
jgi:hypothetical protein